MARTNPQYERQIRPQCLQLARMIERQETALRDIEAKIRAQREKVEAAQERLRNAQNFHDQREAQLDLDIGTGLVKAMGKEKKRIEEALTETTNDYNIRGCRFIL